MITIEQLREAIKDLPDYAEVEFNFIASRRLIFSPQKYPLSVDKMRIRHDEGVRLVLDLSLLLTGET